MLRPEICSHGRRWEQRCIECELVWATACLKAAEENVKKWAAVVADLKQKGEHCDDMRDMRANRRVAHGGLRRTNDCPDHE